MEETIKWHFMNEVPNKPCYLLLAIRHNNIPNVIMGHWHPNKGFTDGTYSGGMNTVFTHWTYKPRYPKLT